MDQVVTRRCGNASPSQVVHLPVPEAEAKTESEADEDNVHT